MVILLAVLKIVGIVLLVLFLLMLLLMLCIMFVPFRYSVAGGISDPQGSSRILHLDWKEAVSAEGGMRWLFGALHTRVSYDGEAHFSMEIFGRPVDPTVLLGLFLLLLRGREMDGDEDEKKPSAPKKEKDIEDRIDEVLARVERVHLRVSDLIDVLGTERGSMAVYILKTNLVELLESIRPDNWGLTGVVGLGDPALGAKVYALQGILYPVTAGHVAVGADYELFRYDLHAAADGSIRLFNVVYNVVFRILFNRDVRRLLSRIRRGPSQGR